MNIVSFGGGTNSTAMLIGLYERNITVDLILFADTGAEMPGTYQHIKIMDSWLTAHNMPTITIVKNINKDGEIFTLEQECIKSKTLPSVAYGWKKCSHKHKISPQDKFCNNYQPCLDVWASGAKINKYIGYDAGEERRMYSAAVHDIADKKYNKIYALIDWGWYRDDCIKKIKEYGIPLPGKSSCFFCPNSKKAEIKKLKKTHPDLFAKAIQIEDNAMENLYKIKGLGRNFSWKDFIQLEESQITIDDFTEDDDNDDIPCGCYDG